jgi:hypothetical protein
MVIGNVQPRRKTMSRKLILTLAMAATVAASALASSAADAHGFGGGGGFGGGRGGFGGGGHFGGFARGGLGGGHFGGFGRGGRISMYHFNGHNPGHWQHWSHWHHHYRWFWRDGRWVYLDGGDGGYAEPIVGSYTAPAVSTPGPCTCLTKSYTQDGMVVFADLCTKESAAAPVDGRAADATPVPPQAPSAPPPPPAGDKVSEAAPIQNPSNFAGRTYKDFLAAYGLPMPQGAQGN